MLRSIEDKQSLGRDHLLRHYRPVVCSLAIDHAGSPRSSGAVGKFRSSIKRSPAVTRIPVSITAGADCSPEVTVNVNVHVGVDAAIDMQPAVAGSTTASLFFRCGSAELAGVVLRGLALDVRVFPSAA